MCLWNRKRWFDPTSRGLYIPIQLQQSPNIFVPQYHLTVADIITIKKHYNFAGMMVAVDDGTDLVYFANDHLSSASVVMDDAGGLLSENRYMPFGEVRDISGVTSIPDTLTDFGYTGQRNLSDIGLMDYNARFYSPILGRFIQPDTIVPDPFNPQSLNRFSYVYNNPMIFIDPSGHVACAGYASGYGYYGCVDETPNAPGGGNDGNGNNSGGSSRNMPGSVDADLAEGGEQFDIAPNMTDTIIGMYGGCRSEGSWASYYGECHNPELGNFYSGLHFDISRIDGEAVAIDLAGIFGDAFAPAQLKVETAELWVVTKAIPFHLEWSLTNFIDIGDALMTADWTGVDVPGLVLDVIALAPGVGIIASVGGLLYNIRQGFYWVP